MSGIGSVLSIARTALLSYQAGIDVTAQNVANATTEGYSRQRAELTPRPGLQMAGAGWFGTGVTIRSVVRSRDTMLDAAFRTNSTLAEGAGFRQTTLSRVEEIIGEPSDDGLSASLDRFWASWSDLAGNPTSIAARGVVREAGSRVALQLNRTVDQLDQVTSETQQRLAQAVEETNQLVDQVALTNKRIVAGEAGGHMANDVRDERDRLLDGLAKLGDVQVTEQADGSVMVYLGGQMVVDHGDARHIKVTRDAGQLVAQLDVPGARTLDPGGRISAAMDLLNSDLPNLMASLDTLARGLAVTVNGIHEGGVTWTAGALPGDPPVAVPAGAFFKRDPGAATPESDVNYTARHLRLADAIVADPRAVAASIAPAPSAPSGPTNGQVAEQLAALRNNALTLTAADGTALAAESGAAYFRGVAGDVGLAVKGAASTVQVQQTLASQSDTRRTEVSGVSMDEELVTLMKFQKAYAAAARLVSVADDMMETLVRLGL